MELERKVITIVKATGEADTELAAFDNALINCGIGNYNLIRLSSVLPPNTKLIMSPKLPNDFGVFGDKLYVVYAFNATSIKGAEAWAGVGWVVLAENGAGLFVEHEANSQEECAELLKKSLSNLCESRGLKLENYEHGYEIIGTKCTEKHAASLVAAVYEAKGWEYQ
jgi:arginine decarboxylase